MPGTIDKLLCRYREKDTFSIETKKIKIDKILGVARLVSRGISAYMLDSVLLRYRQNDLRIPANALVSETGEPLLDENGNYLLSETDVTL